MDGWMNGWMDGWMDEWMDEWMDGWRNEGGIKDDSSPAWKPLEPS